MTDSKLLREKIELSGYKLKFIAQKIGISYQSLLNKMENKREFKPSEIALLCDLLKISRPEKERIFFALDSDKMPLQKEA